IVSAVSGAIFLTWIILSEMMVGHSTGRALEFYGGMDAHGWSASLKALLALFLPRHIPLAVRLIPLVLTLVGGTYLCMWHARRVLGQSRLARPADDLLPITLSWFCVFYFAFLLLAFYIEANQALNDRYAFPAYLTSVLMFTMILSHQDAGQ